MLQANYIDTQTNNVVGEGDCLIGSDSPIEVKTIHKIIQGGHMAFPFYGLKIWDNNKLVHDFKPCLNPDGIIELYDSVSDKFFELNGSPVYKVMEKATNECNCWRCVAEKLFNAKRVSKMKAGKVYLYQVYHESFEEFDTLEDAERFRKYADDNIPYWDYDLVSVIDLNDPEQVIIYRHRGWIA